MSDANMRRILWLSAHSEQEGEHCYQWEFVAHGNAGIVCEQRNCRNIAITLIMPQRGF